jgi:alpha-1,6-mannosyltransferase
MAVAAAPRTKRLTAAHVALVVTVASAAAICLLAAAGPSEPIIPASWHGMPGWMAGPLPGVGDGIGRGEFSALFLVMCAGYAVALVTRLDRRAVTAAIVVLHVLFMLSPPLLSSDVFGYVDWARLGVVHDLDPYEHGSLAAPQDPAFEYFRWRTDMPSPYGPAFTLASYATAPLGVAGAFWAFKLACALASLGLVALVAACARRLGTDPVRAAAFVGLNPLVLVWAVGGAHNDLIAMAVALAGIQLVLARRERAAGAALVTAAATKVSAGIVAPYALLGARRRGRVAQGMAAAGAAIAAVAVAVFGSVTGFLEANRDQQDLVAFSSVPNQVGRLVGAGGLTPAIRAAATIALLATLGWTLYRAWRGHDWIQAAGWATFAVIVCSAWIMPWYVVWLLPLAALARDRRLTIASLALCAYLVVLRTPF